MIQARQRERTAVRHGRRLCALALVLSCAVAGVAPGQEGAAPPWTFDSRAEEAQARRQFGANWFEIYPKARDIVDSDRSSSEEIDEAIGRLRLCIGFEPQSQANKLDPISRRNVVYLPYVYLGRALLRSGRADRAELASRCFAEEESQGQLARARVPFDFAALKSQVDAVAAVAPLLAQADRVAAWTSSDGAVQLGSDARGRLGRVGEAASGLRQASGAAGDASTLQRLSEALREELVGLCSAELGALRPRLERLGAEPWRGAFAGKRGALEADVCAMPADATGAAGVGAAVERVESCSTRVRDALRTAGAWTCDRIAERRQRLVDALGELAAEGGQAAPAEALPGACGVTWNRSEIPALEQALGALDPAALAAGYDSRITAVRAQLDGILEARFGKVRVARGRLPDRLPAGCRDGLALQDAEARLARLRLPEAEAAKSSSYVEDVDSALAALSTDLEAGVRSVHARSERFECAVDLAGLDHALAAWRQSSADLAGVCTAVATAGAAIGECVKNNVELLAAQVADDRWLIDAAARGLGGASAAIPPETAECVRAVRAAAPAPAPRGDPGRWAASADEWSVRAQACLRAYHGRRREVLDGVARRAGSVGEALSAVGPGEGGGGDETLGRLVALAGQAQEIHRKVAGLAALLDAGAALSADDLRGRLEPLGLAGAVPADTWDRLREVGTDGERGLAFLRAAVDQALGPVLAGAEADLGRWERLVPLLDPYLALTAAFERFDAGDLDGAILALRGAWSRGKLPAAGRAAALSHAALAYFLYLKAGSDRTGAAELAERDARFEARRAAAADDRFRLSANLFPSPGFREFFEDSGATR